jgi:hypothetical protein
MKCGGPGGSICGGSNYVSVWRLECDAWGRSFLLVMCGLVAAYVGGGTAYNMQVKGLRGTAALPHPMMWQELGALVRDGVQYTRVQASGQAALAARGGKSGADGVTAPLTDA